MRERERKKKGVDNRYNNIRVQSTQRHNRAIQYLMNLFYMHDFISLWHYALCVVHTVLGTHIYIHPSIIFYNVVKRIDNLYNAYKSK